MKRNDAILLGILLVGVILFLGGGSAGSVVNNYFTNQSANERVLWLENDSLRGYTQNENIEINMSREGGFLNINRSFVLTQYSFNNINYVVLDAIYGYGRYEYKNVNLSTLYGTYPLAIRMGLDKLVRCDRLTEVSRRESVHPINLDNDISIKWTGYYGRVKLNVSGAFGNLVTEGDGSVYMTSGVVTYTQQGLVNVTCNLWGDYFVKNKLFYEQEFLQECIVEGKLDVNLRTSTGSNMYIQIPSNTTTFYRRVWYQLLLTATSLIDNWYFGGRLNLSGNLDDWVVRSFYSVTYANITITDLVRIQSHYNTTNHTHIQILRSKIPQSTSVDHPSIVYLYGIRQADITNVIQGNSNNLCDTRNIMALRATKTRMDFVPKTGD